MDNLFHIRQRRISMPKRTSELVALMAISTTLFLFIHTRDLHSRLKQMEVRMQPEDMISSNQVSGGQMSGHPHVDRQLLDGNSAGSAMNAMVRMLTETGEMDQLDAHALNNTAKAGVDLIFFNRVPKVGSQTFMELLRRLSIRNQFGFHRDHMQKVETIRLAPADQLALAVHVNSFPQPSVYTKHVCFTNFSAFGLPEPIYVNLVRDPIERVISWYYYIRAPWYYVERKQAFPEIPLPDPRWLKKDFETCVLQGDRECRYIEGETHEGIGDHRRQSLFFCGQSEACTPFNTIGALQRAKLAVERHYAVVGVLEDMNSTLTVLEHYIPKFFSGASQIYREEVDQYARINKNMYKPPVSEVVKDIVRQNFTREVEFYQFCRQRLHRQLLALRLPTP